MYQLGIIKAGLTLLLPFTAQLHFVGHLILHVGNKLIIKQLGGGVKGKYKRKFKSQNRTGVE